MAAQITPQLTLYSVRDSHGLIYVAEDSTDTIRTLHFDTPIEQSRYYLNAPFTLGFEYLEVAFKLFMQASPNTLLCLGLGGGRLNTQLHYALPQCQQHIVELRPEVAKIAYQWFDLPETDHLSVEMGDAFHFIVQNTARYDALFIDVFDGIGMPAQFADDSFMQHALAACAPQGKLLMNLWRNDPAVNFVLLPWLQTEGIDFTLHKIKSSPNWILEIQH